MGGSQKFSRPNSYSRVIGYERLNFSNGIDVHFAFRHDVSVDGVRVIAPRPLSRPIAASQ
jgi:hypothetical protein